MIRRIIRVLEQYPRLSISIFPPSSGWIPLRFFHRIKHWLYNASITPPVCVFLLKNHLTNIGVITKQFLFLAYQKCIFLFKIRHHEGFSFFTHVVCCRTVSYPSTHPLHLLHFRLFRSISWSLQLFTFSGHGILPLDFMMSCPLSLGSTIQSISNLTIKKTPKNGAF